MSAIPQAFGDEFTRESNQRQILPGGRAAMMGGAFTALADDASGGYYNPAGMTHSKDSGLTVSTTLLRESNIVFQDTINGEPFDQKSSTFVPGFIGGMAKFGFLTLGYSVITIEAEDIYHQNTFENISTSQGTVNLFSRTVQESRNQIMAGGSWSIPLVGPVSIGHSLFYYQQEVNSSANQFAAYNGGGTFSIFKTYETLNTGLTHVGGIMVRTDVFSVGASFKKSYLLSNDTKFVIESVTDSSVQEVPTINTRLESSDPSKNAMTPTTYTLGLAWFPHEAVTLSADYLIHEGVKNRYKDLGGADLRTTANYSFGMEVELGRLSLRAGYFTNYSLHADLEDDQVNQAAHIDYTGTAVGVGLVIAGVQGHFGIVDQIGSGEAQVITNSTNIQEVEARNTSYLISGKLPLQ
jgi:long-chain fatty acid transport protein